MAEGTHASDVRWLVILNLHGADEPIYLRDPESWRHDPHLQATQDDACCVAKLNAPSIPEAITMVQG